MDGDLENMVYEERTLFDDEHTKRVQRKAIIKCDVPS